MPIEKKLIVQTTDGKLLIINSGVTISSLDADKLDGMHASAFAPVSHTHDISGLIGGAGKLTEAPIGDIDGSNTIFYTSVQYVPNSLRVWLNGIKLITSVDYVENEGFATFTFTEPPNNTGFVDSIEIEYIPAVL